MLRRAVLVVLLLGWQVAMADAPSTKLVRDLVAHPPSRMSELENIVGKIAMSFRDEDHDNMGMLWRPRAANQGEFTAVVPRLTVKYAWDMYHEDPRRVRDVALEDYTLTVRGDADAAEKELRAKLGPPRALPDHVTGFHPFYLTRSGGDTFQLSWYREVPRFAIPDPDPRARASWLAALAKKIASAKSIDDIDAFCKAAPTDAGIKITGTLNTTANPYGRPIKDGRDYWLEFVPPVRARVVADAFGWGEVIGVSHDVHMSSWHLERKNDKWYPTSGADAQWQVDAGLAGHPSGGFKEVRRGGVELGADDEVRVLAVEPRFK